MSSKRYASTQGKLYFAARTIGALFVPRQEASLGVLRNQLGIYSAATHQDQELIVYATTKE
jgi:hypothetical protein